MPLEAQPNAMFSLESMVLFFVRLMLKLYFKLLNSFECDTIRRDDNVRKDGIDQ